MKKDIQNIKDWIVKNYSKLPESEINEKKLVIFATGDFSGEYGYGSADLESWGVDSEGRLFWAYASGCSCGTSADVEEKTIKMFEAEPMTENTDITKAIELFKKDEDGFAESISSHNYSDY